MIELKKNDKGIYRDGFGDDKIYMEQLGGSHHPECIGERCHGCQCCGFVCDHYIAAWCHKDCNSKKETCFNLPKHLIMNNQLFSLGGAVAIMLMNMGV